MTSVGNKNLDIFLFVNHTLMYFCPMEKKISNREYSFYCLEKLLKENGSDIKVTIVNRP